MTTNIADILQYVGKSITAKPDHAATKRTLLPDDSVKKMRKHHDGKARATDVEKTFPTKCQRKDIKPGMFAL